MEMYLYRWWQLYNDKNKIFHMHLFTCLKILITNWMNFFFHGENFHSHEQLHNEITKKKCFYCIIFDKFFYIFQYIFNYIWYVIYLMSIKEQILGNFSTIFLSFVLYSIINIGVYTCFLLCMFPAHVVNLACIIYNITVVTPRKHEDKTK